MPVPVKLASRLLVLLLLGFLAACNGESGSADVVPPAQQPDPDPVGGGGDGAAGVAGGGVKGPMQFATVELFTFDGSAADGRGVRLDEGATDAAAAIVDLSVPADAEGLLLVVVRADDDTTDLTTGVAPVIRELVTIVEADALRADPPARVYATPLTTLALDMALAGADTAVNGFSGDGDGMVTAAELRAALTIAERRIADQFGFGLLGDVDLFTTPPVLLEGETDDEATQARVARLRTAIEAVGALVAKLAGDRDGAVGDVAGTTSADALFTALRRDAADGVVDGIAGDEAVALFEGFPGLPGALTVDPAGLTIPGSQRSVAEARDILAQERDATGNGAALADAARDADTTTGEGRSFPDLDGDGLADRFDLDDDGDGIPDDLDDFPADPAEQFDTDGDGIGNNSDPDVDGDGLANEDDDDDDGDEVADVDDRFPLNPGESTDTDGDGIGDNLDDDADGDGTDDAVQGLAILDRTVEAIDGAPEQKISVDVPAATGGIIEIREGASLQIPAGALAEDTRIEIFLRTNEAADSRRQTFRFEPDGLTFSEPARLVLTSPLGEDEPPIGGRVFNVSSSNPVLNASDSELTQQEFTRVLSQELREDEVEVVVAIEHFSLHRAVRSIQDLAYLVKDIPEQYLLPGDILFVLTDILDLVTDTPDWAPGHVGVYASRSNACAPPVANGDNIIEATPPRVRTINFGAFRQNGGHVYMGARRPAPPAMLSASDRERIVDFVEDKLGDDYFEYQVSSALCDPETFSCVGLAEAALDEVGAGGIGVLREVSLSAPHELFDATVPIPSIEARQGDVISIGLKPVLVHPTTLSGLSYRGYYCKRARAQECSHPVTGTVNDALVTMESELPPGATLTSNSFGTFTLRWDTRVAVEAGVTAADFDFLMTSDIHTTLDDPVLAAALQRLPFTPTLERTVEVRDSLTIDLIPCEDPDGDGLDDRVDPDDDNDLVLDADDRLPGADDIAAFAEFDVSAELQDSTLLEGNSTTIDYTITTGEVLTLQEITGEDLMDQTLVTGPVVVTFPDGQLAAATSSPTNFGLLENELSGPATVSRAIGIACEGAGDWTLSIRRFEVQASAPTGDPITPVTVIFFPLEDERLREFSGTCIADADRDGVADVDDPFVGTPGDSDGDGVPNDEDLFEGPNTAGFLELFSVGATLTDTPTAIGADAKLTVSVSGQQGGDAGPNLLRLDTLQLDRRDGENVVQGPVLVIDGDVQRQPDFLRFDDVNVAGGLPGSVDLVRGLRCTEPGAFQVSWDRGTAVVALRDIVTDEFLREVTVDLDLQASLSGECITAPPCGGADCPFDELGLFLVLQCLGDFGTGVPVCDPALGGELTRLAEEARGGVSLVDPSGNPVGGQSTSSFVPLATGSAGTVYRFSFASPDAAGLATPSTATQDVRITTATQDLVLRREAGMPTAILDADAARPPFEDMDTAMFAVGGMTGLTLPVGEDGRDGAGRQILVEAANGLDTRVILPTGLDVLRVFLYTHGDGQTDEAGQGVVEGFLIEREAADGEPVDGGTAFPLVPVDLRDEIDAVGGRNPATPVVVTAVVRGPLDGVVPAPGDTSTPPTRLTAQVGASLRLDSAALNPATDFCAARPTGLRCAAGSEENVLVMNSNGQVGAYDPVDGRFRDFFLGGGAPNFTISSGWQIDQAPDNCLLATDSDGLHLYDPSGSLIRSDGAGNEGDSSSLLISGGDQFIRGFTFHSPDDGASWHLYIVKNDAQIVRFDYGVSGASILSNRTVLVDQPRLDGDTADIEFNDIEIFGGLIHVGDESPTATGDSGPVDRVFRYRLDGSFVDVFLDDLATPYQIGTTLDGFLYVVDFGLESLRILDGDGTLRQFYVLDPSGVGGPTETDERPRGAFPLRGGDYQVGGRFGVSTIPRQPTPGTGTSRDLGSSERFMGRACLAP